ncbi:alanine racemase [Azospirillum sp. ST 5-10]|uniref:alanine racemase n=1 Tax=unclassified Azospirillum TaxID=2630922 RepID=UPI003F4A51DD
MERTGAAALNAPLVGRPGSRWELETPALVLDLDVAERNLAAMAARAAARGVALRPHGKTHKCLALARAQIEAGAIGLCAAKLGELEVFHAGGVPGLLLTAPLASPRKIARLAALAASGGRITVTVDRLDLIEALEVACAAAGGQLDVLVDVDLGQRRTGFGDPAAAVAAARRLASCGRLRYAGVQAYAGHLQHEPALADRRARLDAEMERLRAVIAALAGAGLPPAIVSGGGTGSHALDLEAGVFTELQVGSYAVMDNGYAAVELDGAAVPPFATALFVHATVVAHTGDGAATTDAGTKSFGLDGPPPLPVHGAPAGSRYDFSGDEFGRLTVPDGAALPPVGARIVCTVPHCDPTVNLYDVFHTVRGDRLVGFWPIEARGRAD